ncbi:hypothetical protein AeNC1_018172 [Aphanomyces euteiches]|nr:hypothetical protein AeNC1_018172 [Aphanomyces euteiches]
MRKCKTYRKLGRDDLFVNLIDWINQCEEYALPIVTYRSIRSKAISFSQREMAPSDVPEKTKSFSDGWIHRLLRRYGLRSRHTRGEAASVDKSTVKAGRLALLEVTAAYEPCNIYNMDENAFFFRKPPTRSITRNTMSGFKMSKKRMTFALACNSTGTDKIPLLFIGNAQNPRAFKRLTPDQLGIDYACPSKGWMASNVFSKWLSRFNARMSGENRHVLLLVDNAPSHRIDEELSNVSVRFLPPNTTSVLQPMDSGVIACFKAHVRRLQSEHLVKEFDELRELHIANGSRPSTKEIENVFAIDELTAISWAAQAWANVSELSIRNSWGHAGVIDEAYHELGPPVNSLCMDQPPRNL